MSTAFELIMEDRKRLVEEIIEQMKAGYIVTRDEWNHEALRPQNPISGACYRGGNRIKLMVTAMMRQYEDPRWMTAVQIRDAGYKLSRDAYHKGVLCEKWIFTKMQTVTDPSTGQKRREEVALEYPRVSFFTVYNAVYVEGFPKYEAAIRQTSEKAGKLADDFIRSSECPVKEVLADQAYYNPSADEIVIPKREIFKSDEAFLSALWHEMSHSTGHESRLNRQIENKFGTAAYAKEELKAEISSLFIGADVGLQISAECRQDYSNYLNSWITVLQNDYNELFRACSDADKISSRLIANYEKTASRDLGIKTISDRQQKQKFRR